MRRIQNQNEFNLDKHDERQHELALTRLRLRYGVFMAAALGATFAIGESYMQERVSDLRTRVSVCEARLAAY